MKNIKQKFEKITKLKVKSAKLLPVGLTNDDYLITTLDNKAFILRMPKAENYKLFNYENEDKIIKLVGKTGLDVETYYFDNIRGIKITKFIPNLDSYSRSKLSNQIKLKLVANGISTIHKLKIKPSIIFNPFERLNKYKKLSNKKLFSDEQDVTDSCYNDYLNTKHVLSHNDLVDGNLLFNDKRLYIIDYEYAGYNHPLFDAASFLSENNIESKKDIVSFLKAYLKSEYSPQKYNQLMRWYRFNDLLWSYWAFMMYNQHKLPVFKSIYLLKSRRYKKYI
jgi:thiamine kinase-like enzyme